MSRGNCSGPLASLFYRPFRLSRQCLTLTLVLAMACLPSFAQRSPGDWARVQNLSPDTTISLRTKTGAMYHGKSVGVSPDSLAIDSDEPAFPGRTLRRREFTRNEVQEVQLVSPSASMLAGAGIGAGVGAGIGVGLDSTAKSHEYRGLVAGVMAALDARIVSCGARQEAPAALRAPGVNQ
jgi:hypothetical protein